jgi:hypothetical protein
LIENQKAVLADESGTHKSVIATLRTKYRFAWLDQFGTRYFQPDKPITIGEILYLTEAVVTQNDQLYTASSR